MLEGIIDNDTVMTALALTFGFGLFLIRIGTVLQRIKQGGGRRRR